MPTTVSGTDGVDKVKDGVVTPAKLTQPMVLAASQASTSGSNIDFTAIPNWAKKIIVMLAGVSTNGGTSSVLLQIGDSGGVETSGYSGVVFDDLTAFNFGSGFSDNTASAAIVRHAVYTLTLADSATNTWVCQFTSGFSNSTGYRSGAGSKSLSATLDRIRVTTGDAFDAGLINILYEG